MKGAHSQRIMDQIGQKAGLTDDGKAWLLETLDPFPDYGQRLVGEVDRYQAKTLVRKVKKSFTLTPPASVTGNWDALIFFSNNLYPGVFTEYNGSTQDTEPTMHYHDGTIQYANSTGFYPLQTVTAYVAPTGSQMFPVAWPWTESNVDRFSGISYPEFMTDRLRLIGGGIEVTNTTADLYRAGQIIIGDISSTYKDSVSLTINNQTTLLSAMLPTKIMNGPPQDYASARLVPGAVSWAASEGCYTVLRRSKMDNPLNPPVAQQLLYVQSADLSSNTNVDRNFDVGVANPGLWDISTTTSPDIPKQLQVRMTPTQVTPFDGKFILITNQLPQGSFVIDVNLIMEFLPDSGDVKDQTLAFPSPQYDPAAIELYSHVLNDLPAACVVAENASGDWFKSVAEGLKDWAPVVGNALGTFGVPGASLIGNSVGKAGDWFLKTGLNKMIAKKDLLADKATKQAEARNNKKLQKAQLQKEQGVPPAPKRKKKKPAKQQKLQ